MLAQEMLARVRPGGASGERPRRYNNFMDLLEPPF